jgi:dTDP-4-amino-4,6-dideoxygalactose transaminase
MKPNCISIVPNFYPLISSFPPYRELPSADPVNLAVANKTADSVVCLPMYPELEKQHLDYIIEIIQQQ